MAVRATPAGAAAYGGRRSVVLTGVAAHGGRRCVLTGVAAGERG
ncbi:hypothetical protein [Streptomyces griseorubiginosus]